jgi:hypothetical protein
MSPQAIPVLFAAGALVIVGGSIYAGIVSERKRTAAMKLVAQTMGFTFADPCDLDDLGRLCGNLALLSHGHSKAANRMMCGKLAGEDVTIFDYRYTTGSGKSSHRHYQTVVLFNAPGLAEFSLGPENFFHRIAQAFGYQDIDFDDNAEFSKAYLLRGPDEAAIRKAFTTEARALLGGMKGWHAESCGGRLAIYGNEQFTRPEVMPTYAADALRIAGVLRAS